MGAWIETLVLCLQANLAQVAPRVGAWIETSDFSINTVTNTSHPVWVRGLKRSTSSLLLLQLRVAPRVGAWIETTNLLITRSTMPVAPRVGAWIETASLAAVDALSHVAPRVGAWIET